MTKEVNVGNLIKKLNKFLKNDRQLALITNYNSKFPETYYAVLISATSLQFAEYLKGQLTKIDMNFPEMTFSMDEPESTPKTASELAKKLARVLRDIEAKKAHILSGHVR